MYQINEDAYSELNRLKNKVAFIRKLSDAGIESHEYDVVTKEQISTIFNELDDQIQEILKGIELNPQKPSIESSE
ncbi:hypothetical protein [Acinetobacter courvalinii]|uniref:Uncharacterized protein n=1 Tax=Acinetobacter courvalinii TaxID=280147 RepID=N9RB11_9GAMM|nr:hypothetical protein [Acinetobacter courvalinii]ENX35805.1 hypothetical protein F888_03638 [Acinetobacter courvalinii]KAB0655956.1 hypothetical protein F7P77_18350 [Acinetobacter courvalinii]GGH39087.1 hypothetical protein GCM10007354_24630 [Acinetobacter courvalinii]